MHVGALYRFGSEDERGCSGQHRKKVERPWICEGSDAWRLNDQDFEMWHEPAHANHIHQYGHGVLSCQADALDREDSPSFVHQTALDAQCVYQAKCISCSLPSPCMLKAVRQEQRVKVRGKTHHQQCRGKIGLTTAECWWKTRIHVSGLEFGQLIFLRYWLNLTILWQWMTFFIWCENTKRVTLSFAIIAFKLKTHFNLVLFKTQ